MRHIILLVLVLGLWLAVRSPLRWNTILLYEPFANLDILSQECNATKNQTQYKYCWLISKQSSFNMQ